jgi:hypothetical protein
MKEQGLLVMDLVNELGVRSWTPWYQRDNRSGVTSRNAIRCHALDSPERFHTAEVTGSKPVAPTGNYSSGGTARLPSGALGAVTLTREAL